MCEWSRTRATCCSLYIIAGSCGCVGRSKQRSFPCDTHAGTAVIRLHNFPQPARACVAPNARMTSEGVFLVNVPNAVRPFLLESSTGLQSSPASEDSIQARRRPRFVLPLHQRIHRRALVAGLLNIPFGAMYAHAFLYGMGIALWMLDPIRSFAFGRTSVDMAIAIAGAFFGLLSAPVIGLCLQRPRHFWRAISNTLFAGILVCFILGACRFFMLGLGGIVLCVLAYVACAFIISRKMEPICRRGFCSRCDYDLTGNTSGNCPECGQAITQSEVDWARFA